MDGWSRTGAQYGVPLVGQIPVLSGYDVTSLDTQDNQHIRSSEPVCAGPGILLCDSFEDTVLGVSDFYIDASGNTAINDYWDDDDFVDHVDPSNGTAGINQWTQCGDESSQYGYRSRCGARSLIKENPNDVDGANCPGTDPPIPSQGLGKIGASAYSNPFPGGTTVDHVFYRFYFMLADDPFETGGATAGTFCTNNTNWKIHAFDRPDSGLDFFLRGGDRDGVQPYRFEFLLTSYGSAAQLNNLLYRNVSGDLDLERHEWHYVEIEWKLDTDGTDGESRMWVNNCGASQDGCTSAQTPSLYLEYTGLDHFGAPGQANAAGLIRFFQMNWTNGGGEGIWRMDQLVVREGSHGQIGFMTKNTP